ncbi:hypothetical protein M9Y10_031846 [Tritrichomonas musculus]|uniref:Rho GTPase n=1 Tax=Tritrichomonas musculus TaxID=1915356 RepID=A0ABR2H005_9EUKA
MKPIKCIFVGDSGVGKTSFLITCNSNSFPGESVPTIYHNFQLEVMKEEKKLINLVDTCRRNSDMERQYSIYADADLFVLCFSITNPHSLENIEKYWFYDVRKRNPKTPIILLGMKSDLREENISDSQKSFTTIMETIPSSKCEEIKIKINAEEYIECSSLQQIKLNEVIDSFIKVNQNQQKKKKMKNSKCILI